MDLIWRSFFISSTDIPSNSNIVHDNAIVLGQDVFVVDVGVDGALAAISRDGELLGLLIPMEGIAIINLNPEQIIPGQIELVVTAFNSLPYTSDITVVAPDGAYFVYSGYEVIKILILISI